MFTVLLVDDDLLILGYCNHVLTAMADCRIMQCTSGDLAFDLASRHAGRIDLLISDICMPGQLDGIALAEKLSLLRPELKVLLMSGRSDRILSIRPSWQFIAKPFRPSDLVSKIETMFSIPAGAFVHR